MTMRVVVCLLVCFFGSAFLTRAQDVTKFDAFAGYSYVRANPANQPNPLISPRPVDLPSFNMHGGGGSLAYNFHDRISGVFDFERYQTSRLSELTGKLHGSMSTFLAGPKLSFRNATRFTPFTQVLVGAAHSDSFAYFTGPQSAFAMAVGGGFDVRLSHRFSLRPLQADYLLTQFKETIDPEKRWQNNVRIGVGAVVHF
jgi:outer membrane immunogenic protein